MTDNPTIESICEEFPVSVLRRTDTGLLYASYTGPLIIAIAPDTHALREQVAGFISYYRRNMITLGGDAYMVRLRDDEPRVSIGTLIICVCVCVLWAAILLYALT